MPVRIGLSYHGGDSGYEEYPAALRRRAAALGMTVEALWLAGAGLPARPDMLDAIDGILFTGGPDVEPRRYGYNDPQGYCRTDPERDALEWEMLERVQGRALPTLAICRGAQLVNVFYGGSLIPDLSDGNAVHRRADEAPRMHPVQLIAGSLLRSLAGPRAVVNSSHHQAVERLAPGFQAAAYSDDGVVEAYEHARRTDRPFLLAVQWHPEAMRPGLPLADRVLDSFLNALCSSGNIKKGLFAEKH